MLLHSTLPIAYSEIPLKVDQQIVAIFKILVFMYYAVSFFLAIINTNSLVLQRDFDQVVHEMGKQEFPNQFALALHQVSSFPNK